MSDGIALVSRPHPIGSKKRMKPLNPDSLITVDGTKTVESLKNLKNKPPLQMSRAD